MDIPTDATYQQLDEIFRRPAPYSLYTADLLWTDPHISKQMLAFHLNADIDPASRNHAFMERSFNWMDHRFNIGPDMRICDFGCGPGLYTAHWARVGARVTGIDFSPRAIAYARESAAADTLDINYVQKNYLEYEPDQTFDLVTMIYCDLCPLSPDQRAVLFGKFRDCLTYDGLLFFDVFSLNAFDQRMEEAVCGHNLLDGFWAPGSYYGFLNVFKYEEEKVILDKYTIIEPERTRVVYNWLQYYSLESLQEELEANGLQVTEWYGDVAGSAYRPDTLEIAVAARKI